MSKIKTVRVGSAIGKIYCVPWGGKRRWEARYRDGKRTIRIKRTQLCAVELILINKLTHLQNGETYKEEISPHDAALLKRATEQAAEFGAQWYEIFLEGISLRRQLPATDAPSVAEVVRQFLESKNAQGLSSYYTGGFKSRLTRFAADFRIPINKVKADQLQPWLNGLKKIVRSNNGRKESDDVSPRTWNNYRADLAALFAFAKEKKFLPADWTEIDQTKPVKIRKTKTLVFTVREIEDMLAGASNRLLPAIAIGAFAGMRSEEIQRFRWEWINWDENYMRVPKEITKNNRARDVPLIENLAEWLEPWRQEAGPVCDYANVSVGKAHLAKRLGRVWKRNGLRHSFISYRLAVVRNEAQVALEAGTSPAMIHSRYKDLVRPSDAQKWFQIRPKSVTTGILELKFR